MVKAVSTWLFDLFIFTVKLLVFVLFGNPLSMFIFNFWAPHKAVEFVKNDTLFGNDVRKFYERIALKWPFFWARWWMNLEDIAQYSVKQQVAYFFKVAVKNKTKAKTLKAMRKDHQSEEFWPDAYDTLFFKYGDKKIPIQEHERDGNLIRYHDYVTVMVYMVQNVRLSGSALLRLIKYATVSEDMLIELKKYLTSGKLNDSHFELLIDAVTTDPDSGDLKVFGVLLEYIRRYGISDEFMRRIEAQYPQSFIELVKHAALVYEHTKVVKLFKDTDNSKAAWRRYCKKTKVVPEAQKLMVAEQYRIFHAAGHALDKETISYILNYGSDPVMKDLIIKFEYDAATAQKIQRVLAKGAKSLQKQSDVKNQS